ncbi:MAG: S53 family peptidase [Thermoplasmata archaeon]
MDAKDALMELTGSERRALRGSRRVGPSDPGEVTEVTLLLRRGSGPHPLSSLEEIGRRPTPGRTHPSREEFAAAYGAREADLEAVRSFARARGLRVAAEDRARRSVRVGGTVGSLSAAFGTTLDAYEYGDTKFRGRLGPLRIPRELDGRVEGVFGLDNRPQAKTHFRRRPASASGSPSYTPLQVGAVYGYPSGADGSGQCIGLIELGGGYRASDLSQYFQALGTRAPTVTSVSVDGATNAPTGSSSGPDAEVELDLEVAGSLAPGARVVVYFAPNTDQGFLDAMTTAIHDTTHRPTIVSVSWGGPEETWTAQARAAFESVFLDAATLGVTVLVAAGDAGADDDGSAAGPTVDFPAASPGVVACGGTRLMISGVVITEETVWNDLAAGEGATGGGVSETFARPSYQAVAKVPAAPNGFVGRGVPDVAGDADPTTGYAVLIDGEATVIGGTSAVAPLWAALLARLNQLLGGPVGYVNPRLYSIGEAPAFHDITSGDNGGYRAGPGWDACTGLGTPDGTALLNALRGA